MIVNFIKTKFNCEAINMSSKKEFEIARSLFVFLSIVATVTEMATGCQPAYETTVTSFTSNATHLILYNFPKCLQNYVVGRVLAAEVRTISSSKEPVDITEYLSAKLGSCVDTATSCILYNPPKELVNANPAEIAVNYTCQAKPNFRGGGGVLTPKQTSNSTFTDSVTYTLKELTSFNQDWSCILSSSSEIAVRWWTAVGSCLDQAFMCTGGNGSSTTPVTQNVASDLCMEAQSTILIRFFTYVYCDTHIMNILLDIQVPRGSELDIRCSSVPPPQSSATDASDLMKAVCSALVWTAPTGSGTTSLPTSTTTQSQLISTAPTVAAGLQSNPTALTSGRALGLGLGIGLGLFVVLVAIVIAVVCLMRRKSNGSKRESKANLNTSDSAADDAGFVSADDVFTCKSFYPRAETPDSAAAAAAAAHAQAIHDNENNLQSSVPDILLPSSSSSPASPLPPSSSSELEKGKGKKPLTLTKKIFTQIAEAAKQEERNNNNRKNKRKPVATKTNNGRGNPEPEVDCEPETSYADVWLYSSTLSGINSSVDGIGFPRQSATEL